MSAQWLPGAVAMSLGAFLVSSPPQAPAQAPVAANNAVAFQMKYSQGRGDRLILKTMNRGRP
jgi:hypothetical protein